MGKVLICIAIVFFSFSVWAQDLETLQAQKGQANLQLIRVQGAEILNNALIVEAARRSLEYEQTREKLQEGIRGIDKQIRKLQAVIEPKPEE